MMVPLPINILTRLALENCLNPVEFVAKIIMNALKALEKAAAAAVLVVLLLMYDPNYSALAASGGRMGGSSFSSRSSTSSSRSKTTPRMGSWSAEERVPAYAHYPSWSSISSSRSYTRPRMGPAYYFSYSVPYSAPSLFGGVDVDVALFVFAQFVLVFGLLYLFLPELFERIFKKTSVLKLQVGLLGLGRSLQKDLNRIAETADTSTSKGLNYVLTETVLALLRYPDYCISAYSSVDVKRSMEEAEKRFNQLSIEERGKFDEETLVNFNNIKKQSSTILRAGGSSNKYIVITILVVAQGGHKPLCIKNSKDLKEALQKLTSIPSSRTLAVEVLWTPQDEDDTLSERELLEDYPLLQPL